MGLRDIFSMMSFINSGGCKSHDAERTWRFARSPKKALFCDDICIRIISFL